MFERDVDWVKKLAEEVKGSVVKTNWVSVPKEAGAKLKVRLLPMNKDTVFKEAKHWGITQRPINCLKSFGKSCPICNRLWEIRKETNKDILKYLPNEGLIITVLKVDDNGKISDLNPYYMRISKSFIDDYNLWISEGILGEQVIIDDIDEGRELILTRLDNGRIKKTVGKKLSIRDIIDKVAEKFKPVSDIIKEPDEEEIEEALIRLNEKFGIEDSVVSKEVNNNDINSEKENNDSKEDFVFFGGKKIPKELKRKIIKDVVGIEVSNEYINCFGDYKENFDDCEFCVNSILCKEFTQMINSKEIDLLELIEKYSK